MISWLIMILICLVSAALVVWPLVTPRLRLQEDERQSRMQTNVEIYEQRVNALESDYAQGEMSQEVYESHVSELKRGLLEAHQALGLSYAAEKPQIKLLIFVVFLFFCLSFGLYRFLAPMQLISDWQQTKAEMTPHAITFFGGGTLDPSVDKQVGQLLLVMQHLLQTRPELGHGWGLFAQLMEQIGAKPQALVAARKAYLMSPSEVKNVFRYVSLDISANEGRLSPRANAILGQALAVHPSDSSLLMLKAMGHTGNGEWQLAERTWLRLQELLSVAPDNSQHPRKQQALTAIDQYLTYVKEQIRSVEVMQKSQPVGIDQTQQVSIRVIVDGPEQVLSESLEVARLFVVAKAQSGIKIPLAVERIKPKQWPLEVDLTPEDAMISGTNLTSSTSVVVSAWWSEDGKIDQDTERRALHAESMVVDPRTQPTVRLNLAQ